MFSKENDDICVLLPTISDLEKKNSCVIQYNKHFYEFNFNKFKLDCPIHITSAYLFCKQSLYFIQIILRKFLEAQSSNK